MNVRLYLWQRLTAAVMAPLVLVHVIVIFYATRQGMSAADILARTRGSVAWASFYGLFVVAVAVHAGIGIRNVLTEWSPLESFLRWSDQPLVKLGESALVFLLMVHVLGGVRLLVIENLPWRDGQKELATIAAALSAVIALFLLARIF